MCDGTNISFFLLERDGFMYNNPYFNAIYNPQVTKERIESQIAELQKMKEQLNQPPISQPTNLTQNFQLAPSNSSTIKFVNSMDDVNKEIVVGDTPFFSKDMSVLWVKGLNGSIRSFELREIVPKDEKDMLIDSLMMQIEDLKKGKVENAKPSNDDADKPVENQ